MSHEVELGHAETHEGSTTCLVGGSWEQLLIPYIGRRGSWPEYNQRVPMLGDMNIYHLGKFLNENWNMIHLMYPIKSL